MRSLPGMGLALATALLTSGCLVVSVNPTHERTSLVWDPALVGTWVDADDNVTVTIERGEWQSYQLRYVHPIETGDLTGYLTEIGSTRFLDLMPASGADRGSFLVPIHATLRVSLDGDRLEVAALSYDWFFDKLKAKAGVPGLTVVLDEKENALIVSPTRALRLWLSRQPAAGSMFGAPAVFSRKPAAAGAATPGARPGG